MAHEFSEKSSHDHKCIIQNFRIELQLQINKDIRNPLAPATLKHPQLKASLIIGEKYDTKASHVKSIMVYQPQILRVLKIVEIIGLFNKFKDEVLTEFVVRRLTSDEKDKYIKTYLRWRDLSKDQKPTVERAKETKSVRKEMKEIENAVTYK